ncbi:hypothetical protein ABW636_15655 [Aquimarina sp. 2201CG1-2-11]|uniref:hypothetical protein n=1 Tax=Aquimarina discodermiae TaxID=3231043 RepID=UPI003462039E
MKKVFFKVVLFVLLVLTSCQKEEKQDPFKISTNRIGALTNKIKVRQLDSLFANDSISKTRTGNQFLKNIKEIEVYEKGGAKLLILEAYDETDPNSKIASIQIIDPRYKTDLGLSTESLFKDITDHYTVSKINNTLSTVVVFVDSIQAYFAIDKKELSQEFQHSTDIKITTKDIPNSAKIKHFWIDWSTHK